MNRKQVRDALRRAEHGSGAHPLPLVEKVAKVLCDAQGEYTWKYLRDIDGNPSTAYAYREYLKMARAVITKFRLGSKP